MRCLFCLFRVGMLYLGFYRDKYNTQQKVLEKEGTMSSQPAEVSVLPKVDELDNVEECTPDQGDGKKAKKSTLSAKMAKKWKKIMDQTDRSFRAFTQRKACLDCCHRLCKNWSISITFSRCESWSCFYYIILWVGLYKLEQKI